MRTVLMCSAEPTGDGEGGGAARCDPRRCHLVDAGLQESVAVIAVQRELRDAVF
jgi:hypothetical protein